MINPTDIPTTQKELFQKSDSIDCRKIARGLHAKELTPIHVMSRQTLEDRSLVRSRSLLVQDITRSKSRVKSFLYFHGISIPAEYIKKNGHWSKKFIKWLKEGLILPSSSGKEALNSLILNVENLYANLKDINNKIKLLCESDRYTKNIILLQSIPGLGWLSSIVIMTHIEDIKRCRNTDHLSSYIGLIPNNHSSGEKECIGRITFRGVAALKTILVESAWMAIKKEPVLSLCFHNLTKRMHP